MGGHRHAPLLVAIGIAGVVATLPRLSAAQVLPRLTYEESLRLSQGATSPAAEQRSDTARRRGYEFLAGIVAPVLGYGLGLGRLLLSNDRGDPLLGVGVAAIPLDLTVIVTPLVVWSIGNGRGGNGGFGWTFLGTLLGATAGFYAFAAVAGSDACDAHRRGGDCIAGLVATAALSAVASSGGAVIGYEASNDATDAPSRRGIALRLVPSLAPVRGGAVLGVGFAL